MNKITAALLLVCALAAPVRAVSVPELRLLVAEGGLVTVDRRFPDADVLILAKDAPGKITVIATGFPTPVCTELLNRRAVLFLDRTFSPADLITLASRGKDHVIVDPAGLTPELVKSISASGGIIKPGDGGATIADKRRTLAAGGQVVCNHAFLSRDILGLCAGAPNRVHVLAAGFSPVEVKSFIAANGIVWLDRSFPAAEVLAMARAGGFRVVVRAEGFSFPDLRSFAHAQAQIFFAPTPPRDQARATAFDSLYENPEGTGDPEAKSWRSGIWVRPHFGTP